MSYYYPAGSQPPSNDKGIYGPAPGIPSAGSMGASAAGLGFAQQNALAQQAAQQQALAAQQSAAAAGLGRPPAAYAAQMGGTYPGAGSPYATPGAPSPYAAVPAGIYQTPGGGFAQYPGLAPGNPAALSSNPYLIQSSQSSAFTGAPTRGVPVSTTSAMPAGYPGTTYSVQSNGGIYGYASQPGVVAGTSPTYHPAAAGGLQAYPGGAPIQAPMSSYPSVSPGLGGPSQAYPSPYARQLP